ncbi:winged helix-turn-helix domain-containing protein [bacterium]|nr:winged helix-turn-helix domain-containing protein [bacterium]MBU1636746.1 winged helix-turn-helix domain-containing protein [bacterium]
MKQYEAVTKALEELGGYATLSQLYKVVKKVLGDKMLSRTPEKSVNRTLHDWEGKLFTRLIPGTWGLIGWERAYPKELTKPTQAKKIQHSYYQGLFIEYGNSLGFRTHAPKSDRANPYLSKTIEDVLTLPDIHQFSYPNIVKRAANVDVVWFNNRKMPTAFIEIENSTNFDVSLGKFSDLQFFHSQFYLVFPTRKKRQYENKSEIAAYAALQGRLETVEYEEAANPQKILTLVSKLKTFGF